MKLPLLTLLRPRRPEVHLYSICWNEAHMLEFFFRHFDPVVTRYVFYDDGSNDGTLEILGRHPRTEVRRFERVVPDSYVLSAQEIHNSAWKESRGRADWVMISAVDEHLHHRSLPRYIRRCQKAGVTIVPALGYQMIADSFPRRGTKLSRALTRGAPYGMMNKLSLFNPDAVRETGFTAGRHWACPSGDVVAPRRDELLLLHYKYLGQDYTRQRHAFLATGLGEQDRQNAWGVQYTQSDEALAAEFAGFEADAVDIAAPDYDPDGTHPSERWWHEQPIEMVSVR